MDLILRRVRLEDEAAFKKAHAEFQSPKFKLSSEYEPSREFTEFLRLLEDREDRGKVPVDRVLSTFLAAFVGDEIVGRSSIRHGLSEYIKEVGGHIGFGVVPRHRRRGYATEMLAQSLAFSRTLGLNRVLLTCDDDNPGSFKTIEACGGVFERYCVDSGDGIKKRRYWIELP